MQTVTVDKEALLKTLKVNRAQHRITFEEAQIKYREKVIEVLDQRLRDAKNGGTVKTYIRLPEPVDYTEAYDTAISMVEWSTEDTVELSQNDFEQYVLDRWGWQGAFAANTSVYTTGAARALDGN